MTKVLHNQTYLDLAMQLNGNATHSMLMATDLGKSITDDLTAGENIEFISIELTAKEKSIAYVLSKRMNLHASNDLVNSLVPGGIGFMQIGNDFIVS